MIVAGIAIAHAQCNVDIQVSNSGLFADGDTTFNRGESNTVVYQFKNFDNVTLGQINADVDSIRFDSINNLPAGLTWATSNADNVFSTLENGCIAISGTTTDAVGTYTAVIKVTAWINSEPQGVEQDAAVFNPFCGNCVVMNIDVIDTTTGISSVNDIVSSITNSPNPVRNYTNINFTSNSTALFDFKVYDVRGIEVYTEQVEAVTGANAIRFERNGLPAGVYVYSLSDGKSNVTRKMILAD